MCDEELTELEWYEMMVEFYGQPGFMNDIALYWEEKDASRIKATAKGCGNGTIGKEGEDRPDHIEGCCS